jgi:hypothetical protein
MGSKIAKGLGSRNSLWSAGVAADHLQDGSDLH